MFNRKKLSIIIAACIPAIALADPPQKPDKAVKFNKPTVLEGEPQNVDERWDQPAVKTHPEHAFYPNPDKSIQTKRKNLFDWRTQHIQVGTAADTGEQELKISPFYICELETLYNIPGQKVLTTDIMGPNGERPPATSCMREIMKEIVEKEPDMNPNNGWEIIKFNLGYIMEHYATVKDEWSADGEDAFSSNLIPYMIFYNRMTEKLRIMAYFPDSDIGTTMSVTLSTDSKVKIFDNNQPSDSRYFSKSSLSLGAINNLKDGGWGVADFQLTLDPCVPASNTTLNVHIQPKVTETVELYGHSVGYTQNITDQNIGDPKAFLMNVSSDLNANLEQAGNYTVSSVQNLNDLFNGVNDQGTNFAVASDGLDAASGFLGGLMAFTSENTTVGKGLTAMSGLFGGLGSIMGTQASAVSQYSPILPQISFSEIYLRGESTTQDPGVTFHIKLPGSKDTIWNSDLYENAATGTSYPLYDEPLGLMTLLHTPQVKIKKAYNNRDSSSGYKVETTFSPYNVAIALNSKSGLKMTTWWTKLEHGINITGRLKIKYIVDQTVTPTFENLDDIDGDNTNYSFVTEDDKKIYTVLSKDVPLAYLHNYTTSDETQVPKITVKGGTALVDSVSLVITATNNDGLLYDKILDQNIEMLTAEDADGNFVPYYIAMKEYPARLSYGAFGESFDPDEDIKRLVNTQQIVIPSELNVDRSQEIWLGTGQYKISGYCAAEGEYNKPHNYARNGYQEIIYADEDMSYYAYDPKQVNQAGDDLVLSDRDACAFCANSETWGFFGFNLREYIERYGFRPAKSVYLKFEMDNHTYQFCIRQFELLTYPNFWSANKSTAQMINTNWKDDYPAHSSKLGWTDGETVSCTSVPVDHLERGYDVTEQFNSALDNVKNSNGSFVLPRLSIVTDAGNNNSTYDLNIRSSEYSNVAHKPQLLINFE